MGSELAIERRGTATHLTIRRPERGNALNAALVEQLLGALHAATSDGTRLVVLRGEGKNFCSGFDLTSVDSESEGDLVLRFVRIEQLLQTLYHYPIDTAALAQGRVYGAGADLFCACNHRVCAPDATFRFPGVRFGVVLGTRRLAARVGSDAASAAVIEGRELTSSDAVQCGLATAELGAEAWDGFLEGLTQRTEMVAAPAVDAVLTCLRTDTRDADMAALVASVAQPGLKSRIAVYRERMAKRT